MTTQYASPTTKSKLRILITTADSDGEQFLEAAPQFLQRMGIDVLGGGVDSANCIH